MLRPLAILALVLLPLTAAAQEDFILGSGGPSLNGTWEIRTFTISSEGSDSWSDAVGGNDRLELVEAGDGSLTGTMVLHGNSFPVAGEVDYGKDRVLVTWSGEHDNDGITVRRTFHAYVLPFYAHADEQVQIMAGTEGVAVVGDGFGASGSFVAVRADY